MGVTQSCFCCYTNGHLIISLLLLLVSSLSQVKLMAEGRTIPKSSVTNSQRARDEEVIRAEMIGSRPPRCERRCRSCGHCEAIQVPVVPLHSHKGSHFYASDHSTIANSRGDDFTNYKPMTWKCKCGNLLFNP